MQREAVFRVSLCRFRGPKFHPKVACMSLIDLRKELAVCCSSVGIGRPLRKQNRIRQSPTPVPSMYRQYSGSNASQYITYRLSLNFVPSSPVYPHVSHYRYHSEGLKEEPLPVGMRYRPRACQSLTLSVCGIPLQKAAGHHPQTKIPHP